MKPLTLPPSRSTAHLYEIEVLMRPPTTRRRGLRWMPMYQYRTEHEARRALKIIIAMDDDQLPKELKGIEDVRIIPPDVKATYEYQAKAIRRALREGREVRRSTRPSGPRQRTILGPLGTVSGTPSATLVGRGRRAKPERLTLRHARRVGR